ncbi:LOW QUALITY PROTEIN: uncharacterized protein LOC117326000 [Pecten maximus]|uniref:LOW QUALITY PROTEIN: uncharacterized protein LOC117326000 n=1 Tax=Pecten maximus TaxID=6579 RepID=UPI0014584AE1|nr:LOW QUALITY PROTEIN: uncharacterized protein LOC117326000 [Pecten maximus]
MGIKYELFCFVAITVISCSGQWNNFQGSAARLSKNSWLQQQQQQQQQHQQQQQQQKQQQQQQQRSKQASQSWQGYNPQQNGHSIDRSQQPLGQQSHPQGQQSHMVGVVHSGAYPNRPSSTQYNRGSVSNPQQRPLAGIQRDNRNPNDIGRNVHQVSSNGVGHAQQTVFDTPQRLSYQTDRNSAISNQGRPINRLSGPGSSPVHPVHTPNSIPQQRVPVSPQHNNIGSANTFQNRPGRVNNDLMNSHMPTNIGRAPSNQQINNNIHKNQHSNPNNVPYVNNVPVNNNFIKQGENNAQQDSSEVIIDHNQKQYRVYQRPKTIPNTQQRPQRPQRPQEIQDNVQHIVAPHPQRTQGNPKNSFSGSYPAQVHVNGDPDNDQTLAVKVSTPEETYHVEVKRINSNILHEDVRFLTVSVDKNGRTVFEEQFKPVDLQKKARGLNYYQDLRSGTFLSIYAHRKDSGQKPESFIEGVLFDELIVAAPKSNKRHKRAVFSDSHTVYREEGGYHGVFHADTMHVPVIPGFEDMLKMQYNVTRDNSEPKKMKPHSRKKRQYRPPQTESRSSPRIEPELLLFVDFALYREFEGDSNELLEYLMHFWHAVNWKYLTIALSGSWPIIDLRIREIGVFKEPNAQPFIESSRIRRGSKMFSLYDAMDSLQKWLIRYENALPVHDIAFLQTGENACRRLKHGKDGKLPFNPNILKSIRKGISSQLDPKDEKECVTGTAGVAYVRGACLSAPMLRGNAFNFGIGEASNSFNGVIIAAHEVGHLLGAYHDGEADAGSCSSKSGYIMSYTRDDSYKFSRFSECSIRSFQNFLRMDRAKCLLQRSSRDTLKFPTTFPGKFMTLRQQCLRFTGGPPCEEGPTQCEHLCCDDRKGEWRYTRSEPAVDGTECSKHKVCLNGQCVPLSSIGKK